MQQLGQWFVLAIVGVALTASLPRAHGVDPPLDDMLAPEDAAQLRMLPEQVERTLDALEDAPGLVWDEDGRAFYDRLRAATFDEDFAAVREGRRPCRVVWFGFLDNGGRRVGRHQCQVERQDGQLVIKKLTGQLRFGRVLPDKDDGRAFVGRSFLPGHARTAYDPANPVNQENDNFGNLVGQVHADRGELLILSIDERGMAPPDPTFFEVLLVAADDASR